LADGIARAMKALAFAALHQAGSDGTDVIFLGLGSGVTRLFSTKLTGHWGGLPGSAGRDFPLGA